MSALLLALRLLLPQDPELLRMELADLDRAFVTSMGQYQRALGASGLRPKQFHARWEGNHPIEEFHPLFLEMAERAAGTPVETDVRLAHLRARRGAGLLVFWCFG